MKKRYFLPDVECIDREELARMQTEKLKKQVRHVYEAVPFYRRKMDDAGVVPDDIRTLGDIVKLPFLSKADLRDAYPFGLLGAPLADCVRIQSTSGTTGKRVVAFYTQKDIDLWEECCARALTAAGVSREDVIQVSYGYGLFTGGAGLHGGAHKVGALTLPMSSGNTERQINFMMDLGATVLCCTPSYAAYLGEALREHGYEPEDIPLKAGIFGAEPWSETMRREIEQALGIKAYDIYGLTEISGPGVAFECAEQNGMHLCCDHFLAEVIDPDSGRVLPPGERGELVLTCLDKEAFPLLRYRTRDITVLDPSPCPCGRTHLRMRRPMGRTDDMLIIRGVNVFPSQIETVLLEMGYPPHYRIVVDRVNHTDTLDVDVEMTAGMFSDRIKDLTEREAALTRALRDMLGITAKVHLVAPKSVERSEGKAVRVIDRRKLV
ncbi:MAG: phenylacetate--CoA ligase [Clostridia bacterium]|nr:phenylacetate--CoA ligase [Clostridia bacterium]